MFMENPKRKACIRRGQLGGKSRATECKNKMGKVNPLQNTKREGEKEKKVENIPLPCGPRKKILEAQIKQIPPLSPIIGPKPLPLRKVETPLQSSSLTPLRMMRLCLCKVWKWRRLPLHPKTQSLIPTKKAPKI